MAHEFCELVRTKRLEKYKTAKSFFKLNSIHCTYAYYSKIEKEVVPDLRLALQIIDKLKLNHRKALHAWVRDQMPSAELKSFFSEIDDNPPLSSEQKSIERSLVINRMQARLLQRDPIFWEILVYLGSYFKRGTPTVRSMAKDFHLSVSSLNDLLLELFDYGFIDRDEKGNFFSKEWVFIPYESEFQPLRNLNFKRAFEQFSRATEENKFRTTITGLLGPDQWKAVEAKILALTNFIVDISEVESSAAIPYTVGVFGSPRSFGNE